MLKGLACGGFKLGSRGFWVCFGCMREHVDALGSSAQDTNGKRYTRLAHRLQRQR